MAKTSTIFVCSNCGYESGKWLGKCPACNEWNSFYEEKINNVAVSSNNPSGKQKSATPRKLKEVEGIDATRISTGIDELDRVLGGGLVKGSLVLVGGEPGIGKSTLILQICDQIIGEGKVLYVSGEESAEQVKIRADRLNINNDNIMFLGETDIDIIQEAILNTNPKLVIIDSIQTMYSEDITSAAGTVSQVREITARIMRICKENNITTIIIGHVTKDGNIAGPRVLEHMVDTVLYLEGERYFSYRMLRSVKNRFGSTNELGMFEMKNEGMVEITNPSSILISEREDNPTGSVVVASMEGTRPLLIELQALTSASVFGIPKRTADRQQNFPLPLGGWQKALQGSDRQLFKPEGCGELHSPPAGKRNYRRFHASACRFYTRTQSHRSGRRKSRCASAIRMIRRTPAHSSVRRWSRVKARSALQAGASLPCCA